MAELDGDTRAFSLTERDQKERQQAVRDDQDDDQHLRPLSFRLGRERALARHSAKEAPFGRLRYWLGLPQAPRCRVGFMASKT